jgi:outer membrane protein assembly factor BamB
MLHSCRLLAIALAFATSSAAAEEWTRFRGPNGTGISEATTVPTSFTESDYNWKVRLPGGGHSAPVIWQDKIFLASAEDETADRHALCLSTRDGSIVWQKTYKSSRHQRHNFNSFASATPAVDELHAYFVWSTPEEYTLLALDHAGNEAWKRDLGPFVSQHSCGTSPIVFEDLLILGNDQDGEGQAKKDGKPAGGKSFLIAVDRKTGSTRWTVDRDSDVVAYSTPCIYQPEGSPPQVIFNSSAHGITSINPKSGKINWEVGGLFDKRSCSSPILADGLLIGSCGSGGGGNYLVAIHPGGTDKPKAGQLAYRIDKAAPYVPTPIARNGLLFLWADGGVVSCVRAGTGETLWSNRVGGNYFGSPICVQDRIYNIAADGTLVVVAAADTFNLLAKNSLGELSHSTPAVANGTMYLRTFSHLISVGGKKSAE